MAGLSWRVAVDGPGSPRVAVEVADATLSAALSAHLRARLDAAVAARDLPDVPRVRGPLAVEGAVVLLPAGPDPAALLAAAEAAEQGGARAIQVVWSGAPATWERAVFAVTEAWRGAKRRCPLVVAPDEAAPPALEWALGAGGPPQPVPAPLPSEDAPSGGTHRESWR